MHKRQQGAAAELLVIKYFIEKGYELWWHNFYCRGGEIDLVFYQEGLIYFVEVRSINSKSLDYLPFKLPYLKRNRLVKAIYEFQLQYQLYQDFCLELVVVVGTTLYFFPDV